MRRRASRFGTQNNIQEAGARFARAGSHERFFLISGFPNFVDIFCCLQGRGHLEGRGRLDGCGRRDGGGLLVGHGRLDGRGRQIFLDGDFTVMNVS